MLSKDWNRETCQAKETEVIGACRNAKSPPNESDKCEIFANHSSAW